MAKKRYCLHWAPMSTAIRNIKAASFQVPVYDYHPNNTNMGHKRNAFMVLVKKPKNFRENGNSQGSTGLKMSWHKVGDKEIQTQG